MLNRVWDRVRNLRMDDVVPVKRIEVTGIKPERDAKGMRLGTPTVVINGIAHHADLSIGEAKGADGITRVIFETRVETHDGLEIRIRHRDRTQSPYAVQVYKDYDPDYADDADPVT